MSNRLAFLEAGAYCTAACFPPITTFDPNHCFHYNYHNLLLLIAFAVVATWFAALTKIVAYQYIFNSLRSLMLT